MSERVRTILYMAAVAGLFTAAVSGVQIATAGRIAANRDTARKRVILRVLGAEVPPSASASRVSAVYDERVKESGIDLNAPGGNPVLVATAEDGSVSGYAFRVEGQGLWDVIQGYVAVSADRRRLLGLAFYKHNETPGLGAEITKPWFERQFEGLDLPAEGEARGKLIRLVSAGAEQSPGDVDAITGATLTSAGVEECVNAGLARFLERMAAEPPAIDKAER